MIGEGSQLVSVDVETILYAIFDVTAKCIFGFILVAGHNFVADETGHIDSFTPLNLQK